MQIVTKGLCLGILEAKMRPFVALLNRPVDFASSCNARRLFAQVIQLLPVDPNNHTICHLELSLTQTSGSRWMVGLHRPLILTNASSWWPSDVDRVQAIPLRALMQAIRDRSGPIPTDLEEGGGISLFRAETASTCVKLREP
ncbi:hypothetical protein [Bradyrhizobium sp. SSUT77]|uniref:hypothetical protein n=1 Tax=Bradyrhizobium sp. SSUT77 TaxID=3040603 RepID=UPI00244D4F4A|nr:hypothetical protein [Bradyrhizobium sp. SSUT77]MDH2348983.1 hypothetical protein [Bradyrhizobium sp. SSUT77]